MKKITPYKTYRNALASLDNGGRFFDFWSKADDGDITSAELRKAAGVFSGMQKTIIYLEMSLISLDREAKEKVLAHLSGDLQESYSKYKPTCFLPAEASQSAVIAQSAVIKGIPKLLDSKTEFTGFIMIPIMTGKTTTFTMIPIMDQYDIYELRDEESEEDFFIAHNRGGRKLPEQAIHCGGVIKELKGRKGEESGKFLETLYYSL